MSNISNFFEFIKFLVVKPVGNLNKEQLGVNCFFNQSYIGTMDEQAQDICSLGIKNVRVLCCWDNNLQPAVGRSLNFCFLDSICRVLERYNLNATMVIMGAPSWLMESTLDPKVEFLAFVKEVVLHFKNSICIDTYQIGNEPNNPTTDNLYFGFTQNPKTYVNYLRHTYNLIKSLDTRKKIINAATTSIIQGSPDTLNYNKKLISYGILDSVDWFAFHYYGDSFWNLLKPDSALSFLQDIFKPLVITELGNQKPGDHLRYAKEKIPYLFKKLPRLEKVYWYQYDGGEDTVKYGLAKNNSTLYDYLKRKR